MTRGEAQQRGWRRVPLRVRRRELQGRTKHCAPFMLGGRDDSCVPFSCLTCTQCEKRPARPLCVSLVVTCIGRSPPIPPPLSYRYLVAEPPTSITVSPNGEYIATAHASTNALCVWANRAFFSSALLTAATDTPTPLEMPVAAGGGEAEEDQSDDDEDEERGATANVAAEGEDEEDDEDEDEDEGAATSARLLENCDVPQMATCITLSSLPASHMRTILHLDTIQQRNLPKAPPKAPERAPFFLPTTAGVQREFAPLAAGKGSGAGGGGGGSGSTGGAGAAAVGGGGKPVANGGPPAEEIGDGAAHDPMAGWASGEEDDDGGEWAAAAAASGVDEDVDEGKDSEAARTAVPLAKRPRTSRLISSHGRPDLSPLQALVRKADEANDSAIAASASTTAAASMIVVINQAAVQTPEVAAAAAADEDVVNHLLHLNPSALDLELRGLGGSGGLLLLQTQRGAASGPDGLPDGLAELRATLGFFGRALATGRDFELLQAVLAVFLRIHQATLAATPELLPALQALHEAQGSRWGTLREQLHGNLCLLSFLCRTRT